MSQVNDAESRQAYNRMVYVEFLEMLCRMSLQVFSGSELDHLEVSKKLGYVLKIILAIVKEPYRGADCEEFEPAFADSDGSSTQEEPGIDSVNSSPQ